MTMLFRSPKEALWSARIPNQNSKRSFTHVLTPFPMPAELLESKSGVREIFWSHFQLLKQVFLANFGSWGDTRVTPEDKRPQLASFIPPFLPSEEKRARPPGFFRACSGEVPFIITALYRVFNLRSRASVYVIRTQITTTPSANHQAGVLSFTKQRTALSLISGSRSRGDHSRGGLSSGHIRGGHRSRSRPSSQPAPRAAHQKQGWRGLQLRPLAQAPAVLTQGGGSTTFPSWLRGNSTQRLSSRPSSQPAPRAAHQKQGLRYMPLGSPRALSGATCFWGARTPSRELGAAAEAGCCCGSRRVYRDLLREGSCVHRPNGR